MNPTNKNEEQWKKMIRFHGSSYERITFQVDRNTINSCNNIFDHMTVNIGQSKIPSLISVSKFSVINPEKV